MLSFDVFYYKSKTKLTSAQHPARVHSSATPTPPDREGSRVLPPGQADRCLSYLRPSTTPSPAPLVPPPSLPCPARRETGRHPPAGGPGGKGPCPDAFGQKNSGAALEEGAASSPMRGASPRELPPSPRPRAPAAAPGQRRCRRCPVAFVQQWRGEVRPGY